MKLEDFARVINKSLKIHFVPKRNPEWYCNFDSCDMKEGYALVGNYGNGNTPNEAIRAYAQKIKGKLLVFNAFSKDLCGIVNKNRQEYNIPEDIE